MDAHFMNSFRDELAVAEVSTDGRADPLEDSCSGLNIREVRHPLIEYLRAVEGIRGSLSYPFGYTRTRMIRTWIDPIVIERSSASRVRLKPDPQRSG
jgi:hypothetical protein